MGIVDASRFFYATIVSTHRPQPFRCLRRCPGSCPGRSGRSALNLVAGGVPLAGHVVCVVVLPRGATDPAASLDFSVPLQRNGGLRGDQPPVGAVFVVAPDGPHAAGSARDAGGLDSTSINRRKPGLDGFDPRDGRLAAGAVAAARLHVAFGHSLSARWKIGRAGDLSERRSVMGGESAGGSAGSPSDFWHPWPGPSGL